MATPRDRRSTTEPLISPGFPPVRIVSGAAFELTAELAAFASGPARASLESGKTWIREVRGLAGPELLRRVEHGAFGMYAELASIALETGPPHDPRSSSKLLRAFPPQALRRRLLGAESAQNRAMVSDGAFDRGACRRPGGPGRIARRPRVRIGRPASGGSAADDSVGAVQTRHGRPSSRNGPWRVFPAFASNALAVIGRDVEAKERLFDVGPARDALRSRTNGVDFDPPAWVDGHRRRADSRPASVPRAGRVRLDRRSSCARSPTTHSMTTRRRRRAAS